MQENMEIKEYKLKATLRFIKTENVKTCFKELIKKRLYVEDHEIIPKKHIMCKGTFIIG